MITFSLIIFFSILPLFGGVSYYLIERQIITRKYKKQRLMFSQLKKGDFIFCVLKDRVEIHEISSIDYSYDYNDSIKSINFDCGYNSINIPVKYAKSFKYSDGCYTIFEAANAQFKYIQSKRQKQLDEIQSISNEEIVSGVNKLKDIENKIKND